MFFLIMEFTSSKKVLTRRKVIKGMMFLFRLMAMNGITAFLIVFVAAEKKVMVRCEWYKECKRFIPCNGLMIAANKPKHFEVLILSF